MKHTIWLLISDRFHVNAALSVHQIETGYDWVFLNLCWTVTMCFYSPRGILWSYISIMLLCCVFSCAVWKDRLLLINVQVFTCCRRFFFNFAMMTKTTHTDFNKNIMNVKLVWNAMLTHCGMSLMQNPFCCQISTRWCWLHGGVANPAHYIGSRL